MRLFVREGVGLACLPPIVIRDELVQGLIVEAAILPANCERFFAVTLDRRFKKLLQSASISKISSYNNIDGTIDNAAG